jgi:hypothetical protein
MLVSQDGIATDEAKTDAVRNWPVPRNVGDVRSFLGICSYYRRFVPEFSTLAKPLTHLTEKSVQFTWGSEQEKSFVE